MAPRTLTCNTCGESKTLDLFVKDSSKKHGVRNRCKLCQNEIARKNYRNPIQQEYKKKYRGDNRDSLIEYSRKYREENIEHCRQREREYNEKHREQRRKYSRKYYRENKEKCLELSRRAHDRRKHTDSVYIIKRRLRKRLNNALNLQDGVKTRSVLDLIGCSVEEFKEHLQETAIDNGYHDFDINNYSGKDYHIDHIIPCSKFNLEDPEEQKKCFHWSNMQILTAEENLSKGDTYEQ